MLYMDQQTKCMEHLIHPEYDDKKYQFAGKTGTSQVKRITEEAKGT